MLWDDVARALELRDDGELFMHRSAAIDLSKNPVQFADGGRIVPVVQKGRAHPAVDGRLAGEARMTKSPPHGGEMHPDGDELLILVEGEVDVVLDTDDGESVVALTPGDAFVVPRAVWHRVVVKSPCRLLHFTPGRSQVRRRTR